MLEVYKRDHVFMKTSLVDFLRDFEWDNFHQKCQVKKPSKVRWIYVMNFLSYEVYAKNILVFSCKFFNKCGIDVYDKKFKNIVDIMY